MNNVLGMLSPETPLDWVFFIVIFCAFLFNFTKRRISSNVLVTIGVFGTFLGISIGLYNFDTSNINDSIPHLLNGLKLSFKTSLWGMGLGLLLKFFDSFNAKQSESSTPDYIKEMLFRSNKEISALRGDITCFYKENLRISTEQHTEFISEFRKFTETMAEQNSKALIEALNEIIRDFNKNLTEQFGENFKQLNEAVHKLVDWQENYKTHIETHQEQITLANESILKTEKVLGQIALHTKEIPEYLSKLETILTALQRSTKEQESYLEGIRDLKEQAIQSFPIVEKNIKLITEDFSNLVQGSISKTQDNLNVQHKSFKSLEKNFSDLQAEVEGLNNQMQSTIEGILKKMSSGIEDKMGEFDNQMQEELKRTMETMGKNLASINEKLAGDYSPIINQIHKILDIKSSN